MVWHNISFWPMRMHHAVFIARNFVIHFKFTSSFIQYFHFGRRLTYKSVMTVIFISSFWHLHFRHLHVIVIVPTLLLPFFACSIEDDVRILNPTNKVVLGSTVFPTRQAAANEHNTTCIWNAEEKRSEMWAVNQRTEPQTKLQKFAPMNFKIERLSQFLACCIMITIFALLYGYKTCWFPVTKFLLVLISKCTRLTVSHKHSNTGISPVLQLLLWINWVWFQPFSYSHNVCTAYFA